MKYNFVAIGDIVTDAFILLHSGEVRKHLNTEEKEICIPWGTKIPYDGVVEVRGVGNCANAAVSAFRLGVSSALISNTGEDEVGKGQREAMENFGVATEFIKVHSGKTSNYHYVLSFHGERTILVKHEVFPYHLPEMEDPKWIYLTSLGETSVDFHNEIADYLETHPNVKLSFQPGTFQIKLGKEKLARVYARTEIFFCNVEEAMSILGIEDRDVRKLAEGLMALGPKIVSITDGPDGAYAYDGKELWFIPPYPDPKPPLDRTGAGDAFASTFTSAIALDKSVGEALSWGPINSMSVVQYYGAQEGLLTLSKLEEYLKNAPVDYKPKVV